LGDSGTLIERVGVEVRDPKWGGDFLAKTGDFGYFALKIDKEHF